MIPSENLHISIRSKELTDGMLLMRSGSEEQDEGVRKLTSEGMKTKCHLGQREADLSADPRSFPKKTSNPSCLAPQKQFLVVQGTSHLSILAALEFCPGEGNVSEAESN